MTLIRKRPPRPLTDWQKIMILARVNGGLYLGETLPANQIQFPKGWLTKRLEQVRKEMTR